MASSVERNELFKTRLPDDVLLMVELLEKIQYKDWQIAWDWVPSRIKDDRRHERFEIVFCPNHPQTFVCSAVLLELNTYRITETICFLQYPAFINTKGKLHIASPNDFVEWVYSLIFEIERKEIEKNFSFGFKNPL